MRLVLAAGFVIRLAYAAVCRIVWHFRVLRWASAGKLRASAFFLPKLLDVSSSSPICGQVSPVEGAKSALLAISFGLNGASPTLSVLEGSWRVHPGYWTLVLPGSHSSSHICTPFGKFHPQERSMPRSARRSPYWPIEALDGQSNDGLSLSCPLEVC